MIGLIIIINKYSSQETLTFNLKSIDEAKDKLITILVDNFKHLNIDFPLDISDLEYTWFNEEYNNLSIFTYKIYNNDWITPWDEQDIYTDVLDKLYELEIATAPDFSELYGEPTESSVDKSIELDTNEKYTDFESIMKEIINNS